MRIGLKQRAVNIGEDLIPLGEGLVGREATEGYQRSNSSRLLTSSNSWSQDMGCPNK